MSARLAAKLDGADTPAEVERIMASHEKEMSRALDKLDSGRARQVQELRRRLATKRQAAEASMLARQQQEVSSPSLPSHPSKATTEINHFLIYRQKQGHKNHLYRKMNIKYLLKD